MFIALIHSLKIVPLEATFQMSLRAEYGVGKMFGL